MQIKRIILTLSVILALFWHQYVVAPSQVIKTNLPLAKSKPQTTTILAVGDVMLGRHIGEAIKKTGNVNLPFEKTHDLLNSADIAFGNLECPLSDSTVPLREGLVFRCLTKYVPGLLYAGFDVMSTANNHAFDQGAKNISFTRDYLNSQNMIPVGTGRDQNEAWTPAIISRNDTKFAFLAASYASHNDGGKMRNDFVARIEDTDKLKAQIAILKTEGNIIIVNMHAGTEYTRHPNEEQINFAHAAIDAGADVVIGEHPHWVQDIEIYNGKPIFYSLGNFAFDQSWSQDTREGLAVELTYQGHNLKSARLIPVIIESNCCPRVATEAEKQKILKKINLEPDLIKF